MSIFMSGVVGFGQETMEPCEDTVHRCETALGLALLPGCLNATFHSKQDFACLLLLSSMQVYLGLS